MPHSSASSSMLMRLALRRSLHRCSACGSNTFCDSSPRAASCCRRRSAPPRGPAAGNPASPARACAPGRSGKQRAVQHGTCCSSARPLAEAPRNRSAALRLLFEMPWACETARPAQAFEPARALCHKGCASAQKGTRVCPGKARLVHCQDPDAGQQDLSSRLERSANAFK